MQRDPCSVCETLKLTTHTTTKESCCMNLHPEQSGQRESKHERALRPTVSATMEGWSLGGGQGHTNGIQLWFS
jgi:hypothetical protein